MYKKSWVCSRRATLFPHHFFRGDDRWAQRMLISAAVSVPRSAQPQLSHHLSKPRDLWWDKERRHQNIPGTLTPPLIPYPLTSSTSYSPFFSLPPSPLTITHGAFGGTVVVPERPGGDTNSPVLVMWNKHQLTTHQSLWDSPILFRGEWIIPPNPNTLSAPWLPRTIVLGHTQHAAQITSVEVTIQVRQSDTQSGMCLSAYVYTLPTPNHAADWFVYS